MEISGVVVAASEELRMDHCVGLLLLVYNADLEIHFCILVCQEKEVAKWKTITASHYFKFLDLKLGMLQTSSSGNIFLLRTTDSSTFSYVDSLEMREFYAAEDLKRLISIPGINRSLGTNLVSYQGTVTNLRNVEVRIYELDSKVLLYTTFNPGCIKLATGSEVIVSNAHLIEDLMGRPALVCCGLSCVKISKDNSFNKESYAVPDNTNFCIQYGLNIFDVLWFERLLLILKKKLHSLISDVEILFKKDSIFLKNILEYFLCIENETTNKKLSLVEEFMSSPHHCFPFLKNRLPIDCCVPDLTEVSDDVIENAAWMDANARWKFCVGSQINSVIIGILYVSTSRNLYVADGTSKLSIILTEDCNDCCHHQHIFKGFKKSDYASIVAIQEYDIIVEKVSCKNGTERSIRYIRTSFCRLYSLFSLRKRTSNDFNTFPKFSCESEKSVDKEENLSHFFSKPGLNKQRFLVLSKIWTLQNKITFCSGFLILLLSEHFESSRNQSETTLEDTLNFDDSKDNMEFVDLISKLDLLCLEENSNKIGYLCFEPSNSDNVVFPGHIYYVYTKDNNEKIDLIFEEKDRRIFTWRLPPDMKVMHDPTCTGSHRLEDCAIEEIHGIKEIISKRQMNRNWIVSCVLEDKTYEDLEISKEGKSRSTSVATLCMVVKSEESCIKVYVPHFSGSLCGLLQGAELQLFGFLCFGSQNGSLYLKASSQFGIQIKQPKRIAEKYSSSEKISNSLKAFHLPLLRICFVLKIIAVEIFSACIACGGTSQRSCSHPSKVKVKLCALIDDGKQLLLAHCFDETAKKILNIDVVEWQSLVSFVESSRQCLKFSDKVPWSKSALLSFMNQVLNVYCSSKTTSRNLILEYIFVKSPFTSQADIASVLCRSAAELDYQKHAQEFYMKLVN